MANCTKNANFKVFNALGSAGRPTDAEMEALGFTPFGLIGVIQFQGQLVTHPNRLPRKKNLEYLLCVQEKSNNKNATTLCIDIEHWLVRDTTSHAKHEKVLRMARELRPSGFMLSQYEILPNMRIDDFTASRGVPGTPQRIEYDQLGVLRQPAANLCDYLCPSLYTYWTDINEWKAFADLVILKAIEMANGKPVYPYLCPRYMPRANPTEAFVPTEMWEAQMEYLWTECDGFILWDYYNRPMTLTDGWWLKTVDFVGSMGGGI